ncbi:MAG: response regulator [Bryobacteraceae bacterium]
MDDLFFTVKILDAAKRIGLEVVCVKEEEKILELAKQLPALIVFDLNTTAVNAVDLIQKIKHQPETEHISLIGFVSHVQIDLKRHALEAGADTVIPRSTFSQNLPAILQRHAEALSPET